jgi:hypothetical protein
VVAHHRSQQQAVEQGVTMQQCATARIADAPQLHRGTGNQSQPVQFRKPDAGEICGKL